MITKFKLYEGLKSELLDTIKRRNQYGDFSVKLDEIKKIIDSGTADINYKDILNWTPLLWATYYQDKRLIRLLINSGADMEYKAIHHIRGEKNLVDFYDLAIDKDYDDLKQWIEKNYPEFVAAKKYNL